VGKGEQKRSDWYAVALVDRIHVEDEVEDDYEVSLVLVRSDIAEAAPEKAMTLARKKDEQYKNGEGQLVTWTCIEALDASWIADGVEEGSEVYSFFVDGPLLEEIQRRIRERYSPGT
jgi:hypothetical protein